MKLRTKAMLKAARIWPQFFFLPLIPLGLLIGNLILSAKALRQTHRLSERLAHP